MKRFIYGLLSLFAALILVRASSYGAIGRAIEHTGDRLIGSAGVALLVIILMAVAFHLLVPRAVRRWLMTFPELFHREVKPARVEVVTRPVRRAPPRQQLVVITGADLQGLGFQGLMAAMNGGMVEPAPSLQAFRPTTAQGYVPRIAPSPVPIIHPPATSPLQRRKMDDLRGACKEMGFKAYEYDPVIAVMDPEAPIDTLLRDALKVLAAPVPARKV